MIWDDLIVFNWEVTQQRGMLPVQVVRVRGVTNICEDENLYNLVLLIFYYWISFQQQSLTVPWFHPATESVCHIDKKMSVVSCNPWCTLGCLVCSLLLFNFYFSCAPGGGGGVGERQINTKISFDIPQMFEHDSFTVLVRRELISDFCCAMTNHDRATSFCAIWYF